VITVVVEEEITGDKAHLNPPKGRTCEALKILKYYLKINELKIPPLRGG
jgi:hypothetical protein